MENILYNISQVLGITIIHSLWQGLLIYFLLRVILLLATGLSSSKKHLFAVSSLLAITGWFAYTLITEMQLYDWLAKPADLKNMPLLAGFPQNIQQFGNLGIRYYYSIERYLPYVTAIYVLGLLLNMARVLLAHRKIQTIKRAMSLGVQLQQQISAFAKKLNITQTVKVGFSQMVDVPCIVGYFKPVILLPFTLSTYLGSEEIEAILMHELAHIKRNDYLINLLQQVVTTLLFFNPCVLLINKIIGEERENSCDDMVVDATQNPVIYAKALFKLEQNRQNELQLALAVTGKKYHLLNRIERIMKTKKQIPSLRPTLMAMLILTLSVGSLALLNPEIAQGKISVKKITPEAIKDILADTIPANKAVKFQAKATKAATKKGKAEAKFSAKSNVDHNLRVNYGGIYNNGINDPELERLSKQVEKHGDAVGKYYDSPAFKAQIELIQQKSKAIEEYYNRPEIRKIYDQQQLISKEYEVNSGKTEKLSKQMENSSNVVTNYYRSSAYKALATKLEKKYHIPYQNMVSRDSPDWSENYKSYRAEIFKSMPEDVRRNRKILAQVGSEMSKLYNTPEYLERGKKMTALNDSLISVRQGLNIQEKQLEIGQLSQKINSFQKSPEIAKEKKLLQEASEKLKAYTKSLEFKKKVAEYRKNHPESAYNWNDNNNDNNNEKPDKPEKPEKTEKPENRNLSKVIKI
ncbi:MULTISPECIES: M56 family metallopeptidase [unclassified Mucilaginibacter]|uniref:M56 family metallopeptidase n=1 Tax=unclassified Mucilaginibacter TaxID=2617802 RepID=UPI002AC9564A|nr:MULTISPECIES: M56 family metallopeptidase [unclassified Mucilaginibacter]MEB0261033.1 M56 family metallopeptidase [Mucilaginibacter sp. 10I4]MEB0278705.1 M56 family metallopeptidase [Mucilaginibacter sp. 10B2]MEB0299415.1 M56 family metallopeptidase [Mucilaginibacter sp. 5C4]WPX23343.1 M56 family metallopeptidase [Mucilaginibacter sp. 5C4]